MDIVKYNRSAKTNTILSCAFCGRPFRKIQYSQVFCCTLCKDRYHNQKGDRHRPNYYSDYNRLHPERIERYREILGLEFSEFEDDD